MKEETKEDLDKKFAQEQELRFWEAIFEQTAMSLIHTDAQAGIKRTFSDVAARAATMAEASVEERRKFSQKQDK